MGESNTQKISWLDIQSGCKELSTKLSYSWLKGYKSNQKPYDTIISISTGGLFIAGIIAKLYNIKKIINISCVSYDDNNKSNNIKFLNTLHKTDFTDSKYVLILDDIYDTGQTINAVYKEAKKHISCSIAVGCLYSKVTSIKDITYAIAIDSNTWVEFPWEHK